MRYIIIDMLRICTVTKLNMYFVSTKYGLRFSISVSFPRNPMFGGLSGKIGPYDFFQNRKSESTTYLGTYAFGLQKNFPTPGGSTNP